jgi:hypothetical protein
LLGSKGKGVMAAKSKICHGGILWERFKIRTDAPFRWISFVPCPRIPKKKATADKALQLKIVRHTAFFGVLMQVMVKIGNTWISQTLSEREKQLVHEIGRNAQITDRKVLRMFEALIKDRIPAYVSARATKESQISEGKTLSLSRQGITWEIYYKLSNDLDTRDLAVMCGWKPTALVIKQNVISGAFKNNEVNASFAIMEMFRNNNDMLNVVGAVVERLSQIAGFIKSIEKLGYH